LKFNFYNSNLITKFLTLAMIYCETQLKFIYKNESSKINPINNYLLIGLGLSLTLLIASVIVCCHLYNDGYEIINYQQSAISTLIEMNKFLFRENSLLNKYRSEYIVTKYNFMALKQENNFLVNRVNELSNEVITSLD
jgi:hypothetical protein